MSKNFILEISGCLSGVVLSIGLVALIGCNFLAPEKIAKDEKILEEAAVDIMETEFDLK